MTISRAGKVGIAVVAGTTAVLIAIFAIKLRSARLRAQER